MLLFLVFVILNLLDGYSTWKVMRPDHFNHERNPLARWIFIKLGLKRGLIVSEILWIGLVSLLFFNFWKAPALNMILLVLLCLGVLAFTFIVINNFRVYGRLKRQDLRSVAQGSRSDRQC